MSQETIEKKLAYLDETKQMIGQALVTKGQTINNETPFRDYVQKVLDIQTGFDTRDATAVASEVLKGKTFYNSQGKVEGTLVPKTGDIKKFETVEEMQNDTNAQEGDLAVVYREETQNAAADSQFQTAKFLNTVVLPSAITSYIDVRYRAVDSSVMFDCWGMLDAQSFSMDCYTNNGSIRIEYESSDGITYTRTDNGEQLIDFGTEIYYEMSDYWNDAIGYFIQVGGNYFEGLYQYKTFRNKNKIHAYSYTELTWDNSTRKLTGTGGEAIEFDIESTLNKITEYTETNFSDYRSGTYYDNPVYEYMLYYDNNCIVFPFATQNEGTPYKFLYNLNLLIDNTTWKAAGGIITTSTSCTYNLHEIRVDMTTGEISYELLEEGFTNQGYEFLTRFNNYKFVGNINMDGTFNYEYQRNMLAILYYDIEDSTWYSSNCIYGEKPGIDDIGYLFANTQFTLKDSNELLPEKIAYGKNGIVEGSDKVYNNLKLAGYMEELNECQMDLVVSSYDNLNGKSITAGNDFNETTLSTTFHTIQKLSSAYDYYKMHGSCIIGYKTDTNTNTFYLALFDFKGNKLHEVNYAYTTGVEVLPFTDDNNVYILFRTWTDTSAQHYIKKISLNDYSSEDLADINIANKLHSYDSVVINNNIYTIICLSGSTSKGYLYVNGTKICSFNGFNYDTEIVAVKGNYVYVVVSESRNNVFCIDIENVTCTTITLYDNTHGSGFINFCRSYKYDGLVGCTEYISSATQQGVIGQLTEEGTFEKIVDLPVTFGTGSSAIEKFCEIIDSNGKRWLYYNKLLNLETGEIVPLDESFLYTYITLVYCQDGMYHGIYNQSLVTFRPDIQLNNTGDKMLFKTLYSNLLSEDVDYYLVIDKHLDSGNSMTAEEYQTALDTAYSIRDDATE